MRAWRLDKQAERFVHLAGDIEALKGVIFCMYAGAMYALFFIAPSKAAWIERFIWTLGAICTAASGAFAYNVIHCIGRLSENPDVRRRAAENGCILLPTGFSMPPGARDGWSNVGSLESPTSVQGRLLSINLLSRTAGQMLTADRQ